MEDVLVIGFSTRNVVCSGHSAGYNMYAIDVCCDMDMLRCAKATIRPYAGKHFDIKDISDAALLEMIDSFDVDFDAIVLASGFEARELKGCPYPVLQNDRKTMEKVTDKSNFARFLASTDLPHPQTCSYKELDDVTFPLMVKPACAGGGTFNRILHDREEVDRYIASLKFSELALDEDDLVFQEYLYGTPASVSLIGTEGGGQVIAVNEQLIGIPWLTKLPFAYCGNVTPFITPSIGPCGRRMEDMAQELISTLGIIGSCGVDLIVTDHGPVIIEVNARFQGSMDSVELSTGLNVFKRHMEAFEGNIPYPKSYSPSYRQYAARAIIYAERNIEITEHTLSHILKEQTADIPNIGDVIWEDGPVNSVISTGKTRNDVMNGIEQSTNSIRQYLYGKLH